MESNESITILQAAGKYAEYVAARKAKRASAKSRTAKSEADSLSVSRNNTELDKFIRWCKPDTPFAKVKPADIGTYAEKMAGNGTTPQAAERLQIVREFLTYSHKSGFTDQKLAQHLRIRRPRNSAVKTGSADKHAPNEITREGYEQLAEELGKLKSERTKTAAQIQRAAADKDVRENAPLEAAREQMGLVESRIRSIQSTLESSVIIEARTGGIVTTVRLGMRVQVRESKTKRKQTYMLVSRSEANSLEMKISDVSPLGKALIGQKKGQTVEVLTPRGKSHYSIIDITA
jgi:transcription elongation factor GreA